MEKFLEDLEKFVKKIDELELENKEMLVVEFVRRYRLDIEV